MNELLNNLNTSNNTKYRHCPSSNNVSGYVRFVETPMFNNELHNFQNNQSKYNYDNLVKNLYGNELIRAEMVINGYNYQMINQESVHNPEYYPNLSRSQPLVNEKYDLPTINGYNQYQSNKVLPMSYMSSKPYKPDNYVLWENELCLSRRLNDKFPIKNSYCIDKPVHNTTISESNNTFKLNNQIIELIDSDISDYFINKKSSQSDISSKEIVDVPKKCIINTPLFGDKFINLEVFDYEHRKVDVEKLAIVDPHLVGDSYDNNKIFNKGSCYTMSTNDNRINELDCQGMESIKNQPCDSMAQKSELISEKVEINSDNCPSKSKKCKLSEELLIIDKSKVEDINNCITSNNTIVGLSNNEVDKIKKTNLTQTCDNGKPWKLIPLDVPIRNIISSTRCHPSDPRLTCLI